MNVSRISSLSEDSQRKEWDYEKGSLFLIALFLLMYVEKIPREFSHSIQLTMMPLALWCLFKLMTTQKRNFQCGSFWASLYLIWEIVVLFRGIGSDFYPWKNERQKWIIFLGPHYVGLILPAVCLIRFNATRILIAISKVAVVVSAILMLIKFELFFHLSGVFDDYVIKTSAFAVLCSTIWIASIPLFLQKLFTRKFYFASWIVVSLCCLSAVILARRGDCAGLLLVIFLGGCLNSMTKTKKILICTAFFILIFCYLLVGKVNLLVNIEQRRSLAASREVLYEKVIEEPSRCEVWFGKGMFGSYFCDHFVFDEQIKEYVGLRRFSCETGALDIILHGGIVALVLHLLAWGTAFLRGIFCSKSRIAKGMACYILVFLFELIPFGLQYFNLYMVVVWIFASFLYSRRFCSLSDTEILKLVDSHEI